MLWFGLLFVSLCTGLLHPPLWTLLVWPAASIALGAVSVATESPNYDMHGLGYLA